MIHILYSADYELYLGGNRLPETEVLIEPTARLLDRCDRLGIPITLFADVACLWRYRQLDRNRFPDRAEAQLRQSISRGHDVQTHLHPHWSETRIIDEGAGQRYRFDDKRYLLGTLSDDPRIRFDLTKTLLCRASSHLTDLCRTVDPGYRCLAFRAGGYGLQPDERMILRALQESGYRIDSSIIPGWRHESNVQRADFTRLPEGANYWLSATGGLTDAAAPGEGLYEIPIAAFHTPPGVNWSINGGEAWRQAGEILLARDRNAPRRGYPCNQAPSTPDRQPGRLKRAWWRANAQLRTPFHRLELGGNAKSMLTCVQRHLDRYADFQGDIHFSLNCHPKGIGPDHLTALERFHAALVRRHGTNLRAVTFQQAWQRIETSLPG